MTTTEIAAPSVPTRDGHDILAGYVEQHEFARIHHITARTVARYRDRVDGMPWVQFGGRIYIPVCEAGEWLKSQVRRPNKRRAA